MATLKTQSEFIIFQPTCNLFGKICDFYENNRDQYLPVPSIKYLGDAISDGRLIIVQDFRDKKIVASCATFEFTPTMAKSYVLELSGIRVKGQVGGTQPQTMQNVLMGLMMARYVSEITDETPPTATQSIIAIAHKENEKSNNNIMDLKFRVLKNLPTWIRYDNLSWYGKPDAENDWNFYYADNTTAKTCISNLFDLGLSNHCLDLYRINQASNKHESFKIYIDMNFIRDGIEDFILIADGSSVANLVKPPKKFRL